MQRGGGGPGHQDVPPATAMHHSFAKPLFGRRVEQHMAISHRRRCGDRVCGAPSHAQPLARSRLQPVATVGFWGVAKRQAAPQRGSRHAAARIRSSCRSAEGVSAQQDRRASLHSRAVKHHLADHSQPCCHPTPNYKHAHTTADKRQFHEHTGRAPSGVTITAQRRATGPKFRHRGRFIAALQRSPAHQGLSRGPPPPGLIFQELAFHHLLQR